MSARKAKKDHELKKEGDHDTVAAEVDRILRQSGADSKGSQRTGWGERSTTMKALLHEYTQNATLAEKDENDEHPLQPMTHGETRNPRARNRGQTDSGLDPGADQGVAGEQNIAGRSRLDTLLRQLDSDRLPQIKQQFMEKGDKGLGAEAFVDAIQGHLGRLGGGGEEGYRRDREELFKLHSRLAAGFTGEDGDEEVDELEEEPTGRSADRARQSMLSLSNGSGNGSYKRGSAMPVNQRNSMAPRPSGLAVNADNTGTSSVYLTEVDAGTADAGEFQEDTVTWKMFAKLLLDKGVVGDVVKNFNIVRVLSHMEGKEKIPPLQEEFMELGNALTVEQFVVVMRGQFQYIFDLIELFDLREEERQLIAGMISLFEMVDVSGNNTLSWRDFTTFLVDQGTTEHSQRNSIRFNDVPAKRDDMAHQSHCEKAMYFRHYDKIAYVEQGSKSLKLCTPDLRSFTEINDFAQPPVCAEYVEFETSKYIVVSCSQPTLSFYDVTNSLKLVRRFMTKTAQRVMCWSEVAQTLFTADHEGRIFAWAIDKVKSGRGVGSIGNTDEWKNFQKEMEGNNWGMRHMARDIKQDARAEQSKSSTPQSSRRPRAGDAKSPAKPAGPKVPGSRRHSGTTIVMMLLELPALPGLASCGVDRNVMIWNVFNGRCMQLLEGHKMGVRCMAFVSSTKFLVTGGYDYELFVWNPYIREAIHAIPGHLAPIVGIEVIGTNQVVSADNEGIMKTWDLSTFACLQTICMEDIMTLRAFVSMPSHKRVVAMDRKFVAYDYQNSGVADQTDEAPVIKAFYQSRLRIFISGCTTHLRIWDANTGAIKCTIPHREADITDFCVDDRGRKVFIADHNGDIFVHNSETGILIKKLTSHEREVSGIIYCPGDKNLITVSWDRSILVHDESDETAKVWRSAVNVHCGDISVVAFSRHLGLIATGSADCVISVREYERLRPLVHLVGHKSDITALNFVEPLSVLCSADTSGNVALWVVYERGTTTGKQHKLLTPTGGCMTEVLTRWVNMQSLESAACVNCLASVFTAAQPGEKGAGRLTVYTGDEEGEVRVWDLTRLLEAAELEPVPRKADWDHRRKDKMDSLATIQAVARKAMSHEVPELKVKIDKPVVKQACSWKAHGDSIRTLEIYFDPEFLVTAGYDHMVKIWGLDGQLMTVLRAFGQIPWKFPLRPGNLGIDDEMIDRVIHQVKIMQSAYADEGQKTFPKKIMPDTLQATLTRGPHQAATRYAGYPGGKY